MENNVQKKQKPRPQDERPPVVVSSGSVIIDPTPGSFHPDDTDGKVWRNKGRSGDSSPVRFEVTVEGGSGATESFDGKKLEFTLSMGSDTTTLDVDIHQGDLRIKCGKSLRKSSKGEVINLDDWELQSLKVSSGAKTGDCPLDSTSKITIEQKNR